LVGEKHKKLVQFDTLFHTLKHGTPTFYYKVQKDLFEFLNLEENLKCIVQILLIKLLHGIILEATKSIVGVADYLSLVMRSIQLTTKFGLCGSKLVANINPLVL
jgi:hypothetical protein